MVGLQSKKTTTGPSGPKSPALPESVHSPPAQAQTGYPSSKSDMPTETGPLARPGDELGAVSCFACGMLSSCISRARKRSQASGFPVHSPRRDSGGAFHWPPPKDGARQLCGGLTRPPPGAQLAVIAGNPEAEGQPYVIRLKMPENYKIPAHYHPVAEALTVISGEVFVDMGDKLDMQKGIALHPGGFAYAPAGMRHYGWTTGGTVVQIDGNGLLESFTSTRRMTRAKVKLSKRLVEGRTPSAEWYSEMAAASFSRSAARGSGGQAHGHSAGFLERRPGTKDVARSYGRGRDCPWTTPYFPSGKSRASTRGFSY